MHIDHIGYAVEDLDNSKKALETLGFSFEPAIEDVDRKIRIAFGELDGYRVELVAPASENSPVSTLLKKVGPTPYHLCYLSENIETDVDELIKQRFKVLIPPAPAVAFGGRRVVFMYSLAIGIVEIVERES
ncbi:MAG: VOC family protein [Thermoguttaceae bacterium]|nr:VOC family protein [Thermoguttaceae bacterium]